MEPVAFSFTTVRIPVDLLNRQSEWVHRVNLKVRTSRSVPFDAEH